MKLIILTSGDYDGMEINGLFEISDDSYSEIQSLRTQIATLKHQWTEMRPDGGGTSITSWGGGPLPTLPKRTEEEEARYQQRSKQLGAFVHQWKDMAKLFAGKARKKIG